MLIKTKTTIAEDTEAPQAASHINIKQCSLKNFKFKETREYEQTVCFSITVVQVNLKKEITHPLDTCSFAN